MVTLCTCAQLKMQCRDIEFMDRYCRGCEEQETSLEIRYALAREALAQAHQDFPLGATTSPWKGSVSWFVNKEF